MKNILLITDGRPGHESISRGVINVIGRYYKLNIIEVKAKLRISLFKRFITLMLNKNKFWYGKKWVINFFYKGDILPNETEFDLVISTGGATSFLNIMLSKYFDSSNVYCSSLRGLSHNHFTYLISLIDHHYENEIVVDVLPLGVKSDKKDIDDFKKKYKISDTDIIWSILIGGTTRDYPFSSEKIEDMLMNIVALAKKHNVQLCISTSRRTSEEMEKKVFNLYEKEKNIIKKCVCYNQKQEKVMGLFLSVADKIFVTEESGSMVTESILSKKPVYTIRTKKSFPRKIYKIFIEKLIKNKWIVSIDIEDIPTLTLKEEIVPVEESPDEKIFNKLKTILEE